MLVQVIRWALVISFSSAVAYLWWQTDPRSYFSWGTANTVGTVTKSELTVRTWQGRGGRKVRHTYWEFSANYRVGNDVFSTNVYHRDSIPMNQTAEALSVIHPVNGSVPITYLVSRPTIAWVKQDIPPVTRMKQSALLGFFALFFYLVLHPRRDQFLSWASRKVVF